MQKLLIPITILLALFTGACALFPDEVDRTRDWTAQKLYNEGKESLNSGNYEQAIEYFEKLGVRYPFGTYAQQAQLEMAYAYYKSDEPVSAVAACDRFIRLYPRHKSIDYAYYLKGLANFSQSRGLVEKYLPHNPTERDQGAARQSYEDFSELVRLFPDSKYSVDARKRMAFLRNNLAHYEIVVGDYYMRRGAYVAAANRGKYILEHYPQTPSVPDALALLARAYRIMGLDDLAEDALRVLSLNHPDHPGIEEIRGMSIGH